MKTASENSIAYNLELDVDIGFTRSATCENHITLSARRTIQKFRLNFTSIV